VAASSAPAAESPVSTVRDIYADGAEPFTELEPGTYSIHPGEDSGSSLEVRFTISEPGWHRFLGPYKDDDTGSLMALNFFDVKNVVTDACEDHSALQPPVGPTVDELADAAAALPPFVVSAPPEDVTVYGYTGKHLTLAVPDDGLVFADCSEGVLKSWIGPQLSYAFYGYSGPGHVEELWILEVGDRRLVISLLSHPDSPAADIAEMRSILDSIEIEQ
jgi:hypothetical protein